jgi:hypothetical protein
MELSFPDGTEFRLYRAFNGLDDRDESIDFIGYRVARDDRPSSRPGDKWVTWNSLYRSIGGRLYYFDCSEEEVGDLEVEICHVSCWASGKSLEEVRADFRYENGPGLEIPAILESPPPEVEEMYRETGYDS